MHQLPNYPYGIKGSGRNYSGVRQSTVNNIVSGRKNSETVSTIKKLRDGLGITFDDFFHSKLFAGLEQEIIQNQPAVLANAFTAGFFLHGYT